MVVDKSDSGGAGALRVYGLQPAFCVCFQSLTTCFRLGQATVQSRGHWQDSLHAACVLEAVFPISWGANEARIG